MIRRIIKEEIKKRVLQHLKNKYVGYGGEGGWWISDIEANGDNIILLVRNTSGIPIGIHPIMHDIKDHYGVGYVFYISDDIS
jgi:hypothetical protein